MHQSSPDRDIQTPPQRLCQQLCLIITPSVFALRMQGYGYQGIRLAFSDKFAQIVSHVVGVEGSVVEVEEVGNVLVNDGHGEGVVVDETDAGHSSGFALLVSFAAHVGGGSGGRSQYGGAADRGL